MADENSDLTGERKRSGIQSVEIGLGVLEALRGLGRASPLAAVVRACGLSPSQTHRYLSSLIASGMVVQGLSGSYDLGPAALRLGLSALTRIEAFRIADANLTAFSEESGVTCQLAALGTQGPTIIRWYPGRPPMATSLAVGSVLALTGSATGQVFMAFRPDNETAELALAEVGVAGMAAMGKLTQQVRERGWASVDGMVIPGLNALACPIFDPQGRAVLVAAMLWADAKLRGIEPDTDGFKRICAEINNAIGSSE